MAGIDNPGPPPAGAGEPALPSGCGLMSFLGRVHARLGSSSSREAFAACVEAWLADAVANADSVTEEKSSRLEGIIAEATSALAADNRSWSDLFQGVTPQDSPLHPRVRCACLFVLKTLLRHPQVCLPVNQLSLAASEAEETLRLLPVALSLAEKFRGPPGRSRVKHLGRARRKGMEEQDVEAAKQEQQRHQDTCSNPTRLRTVAAGYEDAAERIALHSAAVSLIVHICVEPLQYHGLDCEEKPLYGGSKGAECFSRKLLLRLKEAAAKQLGDAVTMPNEPPARVDIPVLNDLPFSSLATLASAFCSIKNSHPDVSLFS